MRTAPAAGADAQRHLGVISLLHGFAAKIGAAVDAVLPGGQPGRPGKEDSGIKVTDRALNGWLPPPTKNHELQHVRKQLAEHVVEGEARRFAHDLASGARPLTEALASGAPTLSAHPPQPAAGVGAHAARQLRARQNEAAKKQRQKEHVVHVELAQATQRHREAISRVNATYVVRARGGVQSSAGVSRVAPDPQQMQTPHAGLNAAKQAMEQLEEKLQAVRSARASALATTLSPAKGLAAPLSQEVQLSTTDALASAARIGDRVLMDAANDAKHGNGKKIDGRERRYYMLKVTTTVHPLTTPTASDWGVLDAGMHVLGGEYMTLVYKPGNPSRWYVTCVPPRHVVVPTHLLLPDAARHRRPLPSTRGAAEAVNCPRWIYTGIYTGQCHSFRYFQILRNDVDRTTFTL